MTDFASTLVNDFYEKYFCRIILLGFVPYLLYFIAAVYHFSGQLFFGAHLEIKEPFESPCRPSEQYSNENSCADVETDDHWYDEDELYRSLSPISLTLTILGIIYFGGLEMIQIYKKRSQYLRDPWNYFDLTSLLLNVSLLVVKIWKFASEKVMTIVALIAVVMLWINFIYWLRVFPSFTIYLSLIQQTMSDMKQFLLIFFFIVMMFGNVMYIMNARRSEEDGLYDYESSNHSVIEAFLN